MFQLKQQNTVRWILPILNEQKPSTLLIICKGKKETEQNYQYKVRKLPNTAN